MPLFYLETIKLAKSKNPEMKTINGLLYLWSSHGSSINGELDIPLVQACNVTLNL